MCYIAETVLVAHCLDCPVIRKQKVLVSLQTMPHLKNTPCTDCKQNKKINKQNKKTTEISTVVKKGFC